MTKASNGYFRCEGCKEVFPKKTSAFQFYCVPCSFKKKTASSYVKKVQEPKECIVCKKIFIPEAKNIKICGYVCREKKKADAERDKWINKKERVPVPGWGDVLARSHVTKKYTSWMKRFNACRG